MKKFTLAIALTFAVTVMIGLSSCKKEESNSNPVVNSVTVEPSAVMAGGMAMVTVAASDPDGDALTYTYTVSGGAIAGNGSSATWTAPAQAGAYSVTVNVSDGNGGTASSNGALTVQQPPTQITGTASFPAGTSGDLSNAKVSIYTSVDNWYANQPIKFGSVIGSGATVTFTLTDLNAGNYYLDVWKDNDNDAGWSPGDFLGWYGSGGLGSPSLTEIQISEGETVNVNLSMYIYEGAPVSANITGTATMVDGGVGDLVNAKAFLYTSLDNWDNYDPEYTVNTMGSGLSVTFAFEDIEPGTYYMDVWKDTDGSGDWTPGDFAGVYGDIFTFDLYQINLEDGETLDFDVTVYPLVGKGNESTYKEGKRTKIQPLK